MKLRNKVRRRLLPITTNNKVSIDSEILFEDQKIGKVLIDTPYPFALIKLFDPEFAQFSDKDLINGGLKLKLLKPSFFRSCNHLYITKFFIYRSQNEDCKI